MKAWVNQPKAAVPTEEGDWLVLVVPVGQRTVYGRREFRMTPVGGTGESWVYEKRCQWIEEPVYGDDLG